MAFKFNSKLKIQNSKLWLLLPLILLLAYSYSAKAAIISKPPSNLGLVGYWSFDEGTSTTATDFSGNRNNGKLTNFPSPVPFDSSVNSGWTNGKQGKALSFDGSDDYVNAGSASSLKPTSAQTISFWIKLNTVAPAAQVFVANRVNSTIASGMIPYTAGSTLHVVMNTVAGVPWEVDLTGNNPLVTNTWYHIVGTFISGTQRLYVNGVQQTSIASVAGSLVYDSGSQLIGGDSDTFRTNGLIDEVRVYSRALSASEVSSLYKSGTVTKKSTNDSGLVGYWSFNEGTSTVVHDFSGNGNHGTTTNMGTSPAWKDGKRGKALGFDGSNDYVDVPHSSGLTPTGDYTITAWVKTSSAQNEQEVVAKFQASGNYPGYLLSIGNGNAGNSGKVCLWVGDITLGWVCLGSAVNDGAWHQVAGKLSGTTVEIYRDGISQGTAVRSPNRSNTSNLQIGTRFDYVVNAGNEFFPGLIDEVRIYNRALSADEVKILYNSGAVKRKGPTDTGLVGYWSMNEGVSTLAHDFSGNANHGTLTGGPTWTMGKQGKALSFDGVDDQVSAPNSNSLNITGNQITVSLWAKGGPQNAFDYLLDKGGNCATQGGYAFYTGDGNSLRFFICAGGSFKPTDNITSPFDGKWHHFVGTYNGTTLVLYKDGAQVSTGLASGNIDSSSGSSLVIGRYNDGTLRYTGLIDEVRIYNRALSVDEIKRIYESGR